MNSKTLANLYEIFTIPFTWQRSLDTVSYLLEDNGIGYCVFHHNRFDNRFVLDLNKVLDMVDVDIRKERVKFLIFLNLERDFCQGINLKEIYNITKPEDAEKFCKKRQ